MFSKSSCFLRLSSCTIFDVYNQVRVLVTSYIYIFARSLIESFDNIENREKRWVIFKIWLWNDEQMSIVRKFMIVFYILNNIFVNCLSSFRFFRHVIWFVDACEIVCVEIEIYYNFTLCLFVCLIATSIHSNNENILTSTRFSSLRDCFEISLSFNKATFNVMKMKWKKCFDFFFHNFVITISSLNIFNNFSTIFQ